MSDGKLDVRPGGLEVLSTGLNLAELDLHGGEGFWEEVARFSGESQIEAQVDAAMSGRSAPRVWAIMESPGSGPGAAAAGLAVARILADRGQAVVLVDADEQEQRITRWLGRNEMEGWIDMVRFGASLHSASDPVPSDNRRGSVLGVGSFAPTGVTPDEVADLLARLRRQADDLVLVLPAKLRSQPWFEASHIKLLCWDLLSRSAADTEKIIAELDRMGARPDALLGYGVEEFAAIQVKLREDDREDGLVPLPPEDTDPAPPMPEDSEQDEPATEPVTEPVTEPITEPITEPVPTIDAEPEPEPVAEPAAPVRPPLEAPEPTAPQKARRRSSGIFIFAAVIAVVCLVMLGVFLAGQRGGAGDSDEQTVAAARLDTPPTTPAVRDEESADTGPMGDAADDVVTDDVASAEEATDAAADEAPDQAPAIAAGPTGSAASTTTPGSADATTPPPAAAPVETTPAAPEPEPDAFDQSAFEGPVGEDGWALWLYSLPEQELAENEIRELERRGIRAEFRIVDIEDKGRWYRVYVGSFADRAAAKAAAADLKTRLKHDWVVPARF